MTPAYEHFAEMLRPLRHLENAITNDNVQGPEEPGPIKNYCCGCTAGRSTCRRLFARRRLLACVIVSLASVSSMISILDFSFAAATKREILITHDELTYLVLHLVERRRGCSAPVFDQDDMVAEIGLHRRLV